MHKLDWQDTGAPDYVQQARMYEVAAVEYNDADANTPAEYFFDPAIGVFFVRSGHRWQSTIQTFPHGEVRNS